ncbi:MAG: alpha-galactosidase [Lachnospiraceae bacterium]|nr:alpha-galactosidase [Lachnospiraceae bacterium]
MGNRRKLLNSYTFGDICALYFKDEEEHVTFIPVPAGLEDEAVRIVTGDTKRLHEDSLIQAKLVGDAYAGAYAQGITMRNSDTSMSLRFAGQEAGKEGETAFVKTTLKDNHNNCYVNYITYRSGDYALTSKTVFRNRQDVPVTLEYLTSFSVTELSPFLEGESTNALKLSRIRSKWSHEGKPETFSAEDVLLEDAWSTYQPASVRYGSLGSMPVKDFFPFGAVTDEVSGVTWGAFLAIESSWEMEFYRKDDALCFSGGIADREFGHWMKKIAPGESFETPEAILTVAEGGVDPVCQRLTHYNRRFLENTPGNEKDLPVLFNEYCTTWGLPSHENIMKITDALKGRPIGYFMIDCGWFVEEGKHWGNAMGDYVPSGVLFPKGLKYTVDCIKEKGFKPGIWFEIDNAGKDAHIYEKEEWFLKRDGITLTTGGRRFFDMRNPEVISYLEKKVIGCLKENGFEYMKMDYNDNIGIGCDDEDSPGEGLRKDREASLAFVRHIKEELPDLILENCASGGHKLEPLMMSLCSMASFSDAHETELIPVVAGRLHRTILPRQSQIWAVIRKDDSLKRIAYTMAAAFLGRMCLSGDVIDLSKEQWEKIDDGLSFYREVVPVIRDGFTFFYENYGPSEKRLSGYQAILRVGNGGKKLLPEDVEEAEGALAVIHIFREVPDYDGSVSIPLPDICPKKIRRVYSGSGISVRVTGQRLIVTPSGEMEAVAVHLV